MSLTRAVRALTALVLSFGVLLLVVPTASAADGGRQITRYDVTVDVAADGVAKVSIDMDFDFGNDPGHGPFLTLPTRIGFSDGQERVYKISDVKASSSTGAPAKVNRESNENSLQIRIGDESRGDISGVQTYTISYRLDGMMNGAAKTGKYDEWNWNAIGLDWTIPLSGVKVSITGPADVVATTCYTGPYGVKDLCSGHSSTGPTALFDEASIPVGDSLTVVAAWPAGTFHGIEPILVDKPSPLDPVRPGPVTGSLAGLIALGGIGMTVRRVRTRGRDETFLGLTPGLEPMMGQDVKIAQRRGKVPVAVQFSPPKDARPGQIGTLYDEVADPHDVTATIVDLAVRGYLRIDEVPRKNPAKKANDWTLVKLKPADKSLLTYERALYDGIFAARDEVKLSAMRTTFASTMAKVQDGLYADVTGRKWFRADPKAERARWRAAAIVLAIAGVLGIAMWPGDFPPHGYALIGGAVVLVALTVALLAKAAPARTAAGTAVLAQTLGFKQYLVTAEANQLRFEEGEDLFSRYLPYAIVFGVAERWAKVFADLAAQGVQLAEPTWYHGSMLGNVALWSAGSSFTSSLNSFSSMATTSIAAPTPGSTGGSGFSGGMGGGGFSGGGGGGGGGGGW